MTDQELIQAIGRVIESTMEPMRQDISTLKENVQILKADIQNLKEDIQGLHLQVEGLQNIQANNMRLENKVDGVRIYMDTELQRTLNLLMEGQQAALDRVTPLEKYEALEVRISALEMVVHQHNRQIQELMLA
ncbi:hypothetical protein D1646_00265 [Pseudoflavonifractor sp. 60]|uniref:hypothetical protein n=1 Tax=Pseudoflavonifractor sp. 60 TaxID=2304576 RepID=UPI0013686CDC|nr:hypothetical protein [Pseudoflavonifractor sp. 60]NBI65262.1 hypothetical protein [Pseudoflavonifractor sp. 60]